MPIEWTNFNNLSIILGGFMYIIYGAIYYSMALSDKKERRTKGLFKYIYSVIIAFINSFLVAFLINATGGVTIFHGVLLGFILGLLILMVYVKNELFGLITKNSTLIAIGDHIVSFTLLGALHGWLM